MTQMDGLYVGAMKRATLEKTKVRFLKSCSECILAFGNIIAKNIESYL